MQDINIFEYLQKPELYGNDNKKAEIIQTHISFVVLTDKYVYKIKKPVDFGFLDFSTLEKRKFFCEEEIRLNKRLCPEIYLEIVTLNYLDDKLSINGPGKIVDYAVKMKQFSQDNIMTSKLKQGEIDVDDIDKMVDILVEFYNKSDRNPEIDKFGTMELIKNNTDENFEQTKDVKDITIPQHIFNFIKMATNDFLDKKQQVLNQRIENGYIRDCHGDLHSGNIVVDEDVCIFDCIEFNTRFRYSDVACDLAYLCMDLDYLGYPYLSSYFINRYIEKSNDPGIVEVINFYKCYRAYVRAKVLGFRLNDPNISQEDKEEVTKTAASYFRLAYYYARLFEKTLKKTKPVLFITTGLTGTGKTTIAKKFSIDYNAEIMSTDMMRKQVAGIDVYERHHDEYNTGLYSPERMKKTYELIFKKADDILKQGHNLILDGTFKTRELRDKAYEIADKNNAEHMTLYCDCPEEKVKKYLNNRVKKQSISDGRWEIYVKQKASFEPISDDEKSIGIDISNTSHEEQMNKFNEILNNIYGV